jgi:hypothetical protein
MPSAVKIYTDPVSYAKGFGDGALMKADLFLLFFSHLSNKAKAEEIKVTPFLTFSHFSPLSHFR